MWLLPQELAMLVGSYLDPHDLKVCTRQLCSSGAGFVAPLFTNDVTTIRLRELIACCQLSVGVVNLAQECIDRIESFLARRGNVRTIIVDAELWGEDAANARRYSEIHRHFQQGSSLQLSQNQGIAVEWRLRAETITQVRFILKVDMPKDGACGSDSSASGAVRQYLHTLNLGCTVVCDVSLLPSYLSLHTLNLYGTEVKDVSPLASCKSLHTLDLRETPIRAVTALASCQSLHTLNLKDTKVRNVSALASCQSLHTLNLCKTHVRDVSALGGCQSLHTLDLSDTNVSDVSALAACQSLYTLDLQGTLVSAVPALASCQSLHTLDLHATKVSDVSPLASCKSLHTLGLSFNRVSDVSALASCQNLHTLDLTYTRVSDVSALASCLSLRTLVGVQAMIGGGDVLRIIQDRG
jgi:hypothetical protein